MVSKECFCGCGRAVPRGPLSTLRAVNTRGQQVVERMAFVEEWGGRKDPDAADYWLEVGALIVKDLAAVVHGELSPRAVDEKGIRTWQAIGRDVEAEITKRMTRFGAAIEKTGMTAEEAALALSEGRLGAYDLLGEDDERGHGPRA